MKKLVLALAAAAAIAAASVTPASALTILKPGCCGGFTPQPHWGVGGGLSVGVGVGIDPGFSAGYASDCFVVRRAVLVPGVGLVKRRQLVCG